MDYNYLDHNYENNKVFLHGLVLTAPRYSHTVYGEDFYIFSVQIPRLSEIADTIDVTVAERYLETYKPEVRDYVMINGQLRSYNNFADVGNKLILTVFVKDLIQINTNVMIQNPNNIYLNGFICKPPIYRTTPFQREITDILIAVNRAYHKTDYIPCIAWGQNAKMAAGLAVGTNMLIWGRIQSRDYQKLVEDKVETKTAYEVSISKMKIKQCNCF